MSMCQTACEALGEDVGGAVFTVAIFGWGLWQRWQAARAREQTSRANQDAARAYAEKEVYKQLSLKPPPLPDLRADVEVRETKP